MKDFRCAVIGLLLVLAGAVQAGPGGDGPHMADPQVLDALRATDMPVQTRPLTEPEFRLFRDRFEPDLDDRGDVRKTSRTAGF